MPRGRPVGSRTRKPRVSAGDADRGLLSGVRELVERNAELEAENRRLRQLLDEISRSLKAPGPAASGDTTRRRGRPAKDPAAEERPRRGRPRTKPAPARPRRKITDPVVLEQRRAALTKARAVRAERLAAARAS